jgi:hypothetical protein
MYRPVLIYSLLLSSLNGNGQVYYDDSLLVAGSSKYVTSFYNKTRHDYNPLYNGTVHYTYFIDEGSPYFSGENWFRGSVTYEGNMYDSVLMKYDLVKDQLIVKAQENGRMELELFTPRVKEFSYAGLTFIYIPRNAGLSLKEGFYQQLSNGKVMALCRTENTIEEVIVRDHIERKISQRKRYYIIENDRSYIINRQQDLVDALKKHRQQIIEHIRGKKLKFKKNKQLIITAAADLYNKLESRNNE